MCNTLPQGKLSEMGRSGESAARLRKGPWTIDEDHTLVTFIMNNGVQSWPLVLKMTGLLRCGKSCRLRWLNYLSPNVKRGGFTEKEDNLIIKLHSRLGNRWSKIATNLPGRTDNEIKNHWHTKIKKKMKLLGLDPVTHRKIDPKEHTHDKSKTNLQPSPSKRPEKENVEGIMSLDSEAMEDMSTTPAKGKQCEVATLDDGTAAGNAMAEMSKTHGNREEDKVVTLDDDNAIELLNNYEMINWHLDLKSWINQGITFGTTGSCSNSGFLSLDDSGNFSMGGESSYLQENTIQQWVENVDPIPSCDGLHPLELDHSFLLNSLQA